MDNEELYKLLTSNMQLTTYSDDAWRGRPGTLWYVSSLNAICRLSSNIRRDDKLGECGIHRSEYVEASLNIICQGYMAYFVRNFNLRQENFSSICPSIEVFDEIALQVEQTAQDGSIRIATRKRKNPIITEIEHLHHMHQRITPEELEKYFGGFSYEHVDACTTLYITKQILLAFQSNSLEEQVCSYRQSVLCADTNEAEFYNKRGVVSHLVPYRVPDGEFEVCLFLCQQVVSEQCVAHGFMAALLSYTAYQSLLELMNVESVQGPADCDYLYTLAMNAIESQKLKINKESNKKIADFYLETVFPIVEKELMEATNVFEVPSDIVWTQIYKNNSEWIQKQPLHPYLPSHIHRELMNCCVGFLNYMKIRFPFLNEFVKTNHPTIPTQPLQSTPQSKFSYIISDDPSEIKAIEDEMELYIQNNMITKLCEFIADKTKFRHVSTHWADGIYAEIIKRWGTDIPIQKKSFNTTWNRKINKKEAK